MLPKSNIELGREVHIHIEQLIVVSIVYVSDVAKEIFNDFNQSQRCPFSWGEYTDHGYPFFLFHLVILYS